MGGGVRHSLQEPQLSGRPRGVGLQRRATREPHQRVVALVADAESLHRIQGVDGRHADGPLRLAVDHALSGLFQSEAFRPLYARWFGEPSDETLSLFGTVFNHDSDTEAPSIPPSLSVSVASPATSTAGRGGAPTRTRIDCAG